MNTWDDEWTELMLHEFDAPGAETDEDDSVDEDFSMDDTDAGETGGDEPQTAEELQDDDLEDEEFSMDDTEDSDGDEPEEAEPDSEGEEESEEDDEYEIPDDEESDGEDSEEAPAEDEGDGEVDDEFSMDDETVEDSEGSGDGAEAGDETQDDTVSDEQPDSKLKELETVIFDDLSDEEKAVKIKELKELYITVYKKCGTIADVVTDIRKDEETIQIVEYISNTLIDLKEYVNDYINQVFDSKTYIENLSQLQKYIMIFNAINKVFDQIKSENAE